jgi:anaerobic selenocysteine-containing dehydrogenase
LPAAHNWSGILPTVQETFGLQARAQWSSWVELNPAAAEALGVHEGDWVWVESPVGRLRAPARLYAGLWPNAVFVPAGLGHHTLMAWGRGAPAAQVVGANANVLGGEHGAALGPVRVKVYKA